MNVAVNELARAVLKKQLHECSLDELQQLSQQYPYFGPVHLLLAKKLSIEPDELEDNSSLYEEQVQKTSLYFQNRVWLHYLLNENGYNSSVTNRPTGTEKEMPVADEKQNEPAEFIVNENIEAEISREPAKEEITGQTEPLAEMPAANTEAIAQHLINDNIDAEIIHEPVKEEKTEQSEPIAEMPAANTEAIAQHLINENIDEEIIHEPAKEEITEQTVPPVEMPAANTEPIAQHLINENIEDQLTPEPDKEETTEQTGALVEMPALKFEPLPANAGLVFEPYHTVDYFASQGIRFREEEKPKDRFSTQLKSFTEWLKTMKRIPVAEEIAVPDSAGDKKVEQMAEYSLAERHVITEAMAEVWIKQGNKARAEDIYRKLSLLDPAKSSYFATKIEELKKTS